MLQIAKVLKSNGTDGGILVSAFGFELEDIDIKEPVFIYFDGLPVPFFIESLQKKGTGKAVLHITGVSSLKDAEEIVGQGIFIDAEQEEDQETDFTGWTIYDNDRKLGTICGLEPIPGNLCIYVETKDGEILIPLHEDFILSSDPDSRELRTSLPEGLY